MKIETSNQVFEYCYRSENRSLLLPLFSRRVAEPVVAYMPGRVAANVLTLLGFIASVLGNFFILRLSFLNSSQPLRNPLMLLVGAAGIGLYVFFDNIDGKQAQKTGTSGPLGDFLDHWTDGFSAFLIPLALMNMLQVHPLLVLIVVSLTMLAFWTTHWERKNSGIIHFPCFGDFEGNLFVIAIYLSTAVLGRGVWHIQWLGISLAEIVACLSGAGLMIIVSTSISRSRSSLIDTVGISFILGLLIYWAFLLSIDGPDSFRVRILAPILIGMVGVKHVGDLLQSHLVGSRFHSIDFELLVSSVILLLSRIVPTLEPLQFYSELSLLIIVCYKLGKQFWKTTEYICRKLGIHFWKITPPGHLENTGKLLNDRAASNSTGNRTH